MALREHEHGVESRRDVQEGCTTGVDLVSTLNFTSGIEEATKVHHKPLGYNPFIGMHLHERRDIVMRVLEYIRADNVREERDHEIVHSCRLPYGNHPNGDRNPSARINFEKMASNCWVCGGGSFLWWAASVLGMDTSAEVIHFLNETLDLGLDRPDTAEDLLAFIDALHSKDPVVRPDPPVYDDSVLEPWKLIHPYLTEIRHIPKTNIMKLSVGYGTLTVRNLDGELVRSNRIILPHYFRGTLYGWQSRRLGDDHTAKYLCTPDMPRDIQLYNWKRCDDERAFLLESPMSVLKHDHLGNFMATFGAKVSEAQCDLFLKSRAKSLVLWFDNDEAGWQATEKVGEYLMSRGPVYAMDSPYAGDPGDLEEDQVRYLLQNHIVPFPLWSRPKQSSLVGSDTPIDQL